MLAVRIGLLLIISFVLTIIPMPAPLALLKPNWPLLTLLYIELYLPRQYRLYLVLFVGICMDVLVSTVIGEHIFVYAVVGFIAMKQSRCFYFYTIWQQVAWIGIFCLIAQGLIMFIDYFLGHVMASFLTLGSVLTSAIVWPWLKWCGDALTAHWQIARMV